MTNIYIYQGFKPFKTTRRCKKLHSPNQQINLITVNAVMIIIIVYS